MRLLMTVSTISFNRSSILGSFWEEASFDVVPSSFDGGSNFFMFLTVFTGIHSLKFFNILLIVCVIEVYILQSVDFPEPVNTSYNILHTVAKVKLKLTVP